MIPWHVLFYSFPFVLGLTVPIVAAIIWWKIQKKEMSHKHWPVVFAVTFAFFLSMILTSFTGKFEKARAHSYLSSKAASAEVLHRHENFSDVEVWLAAALCFFSLVGCKENATRSRQALMYLAIFNLVPLMISLNTGWHLVHQFGINNSYIQQNGQ